MATISAIGANDPIEVSRGGTGVSSIGDGHIILGSGSGAYSSLDTTALGSLLVGDGTTDPQALALGTNDHVLTADSGMPLGVKWAAGSGGGGGDWTLITTVTMDGSNNYYVTTGLGTAYDEYMCISNATDGAVAFYVSDDAGVNYFLIYSIGMNVKSIDYADGYDEKIIRPYTTLTASSNFFTFSMNKHSVYKPFLMSGATTSSVGGTLEGVIQTTNDIDAIRIRLFVDNSSGTVDILGR